MTALEILKHHEIKKTPARMAMISVLQTNQYPMSEMDIKERMADLYDRVTFYRNVQTLATAGIIHKIVADNTTVCYALNICDHGHNHTAEHAHFFCEACHAVICMTATGIASCCRLPMAETSRTPRARICPRCVIRRRGSRFQRILPVS